ncbi:MAG: glycosyltransferase family 92 protein, partial [Selenomonadaceae bacterium]|nr:glycosyltransferase family 92 protein [Selenomonadaceae bacterium]
DEGRYLKEWLDYHLLAGVEHFYLYNNDSSDDYKEILAPYVENNLVTLIEFPGKTMQYPAYNDALNKYRFESRYMAFIDLDEFVYPKTLTGGEGIINLVDEILSNNPNAAGLAINWQLFGSNGHEKADYSRGVLERFTRRNSNSINAIFFDEKGNRSGTAHVKTIANPRFIKSMHSPHIATYFDKKFAVNSNGELMQTFYNYPVLYDKIVVNHYCIKSREEFLLKQNKSRADNGKYRNLDYFSTNDRNEVFDDGILKYRVERAKNFSFESDEQRISRVINSLVKVMTSDELSLEAALTCRAVAEKFNVKILNNSAEEIALARIYQILNTDNILTYADLQLFTEVLPEIISRPFPLAKKFPSVFSTRILPAMLDKEKNSLAWSEYRNLQTLQRLLDLIQ